MFWKVTFNKDGSLSNVEPCASRGRNGTRIIYVESATKEGACIVANEWHRAWKRRGKSPKAEAALIEWLVHEDDSEMTKWDCADELWRVFVKHGCSEGVHED